MDMEGYETLKEALDYSQKQNSQAQAEIVRLKKDLERTYRLLRQAMPYVGAEYVSSFSRDAYKLYDVIKDELAKE